MLFMVIERFRDNDMLPIYKKVRNNLRMIPEALKYIDSWVEPNFSRFSADGMRRSTTASGVGASMERFRSHDGGRTRDFQQGDS